LTVGTSTITVTFEGKETTFTVTVTETPAVKTLTGITLNASAVEKNYTQNETLDLTGLIVTANYNDSTSAPVTDYTSNPADGATLSSTGQITVTVSYTEGDVTKTASFIVNVNAAPSEYTVTFNSNGGSAVQSQTVAVGGNATEPQDVTRSGYILAGWYSDDTTFQNLWDFETDTVTRNITLYAKWDVDNTVTVTFDTDGGSNVNSQTVETGGYINRPANPTKRGYNFVDWYTSTEYEYLFNFNVPITSSRTAYAKWVEGVPVITTDTLPNGVVNTAYSQTLAATGAAPITWSIDSGALPAGLTLSGTGTISGTPTTPGTSDFTVKAANAEGNDTKPLSITVTLIENQWADGNIPTSGGEQWFSFTATASTQYIHAAVGTLTDMYVQVYDSSGATVGSETFFDSYSTNTSIPLTEGQTYYIRVRPYGEGSGAYRIGFTTSFVPPPGAITPLTENQWADGNLPTSSSQQWFVFTATASTQWIHVERGTLTVLYVQVYDSSGTAVGSETQLSSSTTNTSRTLATGETYYIRVRPFSTVSGTYRIWFTTTFGPPSTISLTENQWADGSIASGGQQWFSFTATASTQYIHFDPIGTLSSVYVQVYDSSGTAVGSQTRLYSSTTSTSRTLTQGQTYYIRVTPYYSGTYQIGFNTSTTAPQ
jgi:uncharacterized repeat protein (TIGR02543 family)